MSIITKMTPIAESLAKMDAGIRKAFSTVKEEMNQHLDTINQNTNEIQACYEYLAELERKMEKLAERLDKLEFAGDNAPVAKQIALTLREQEVFMVLYTAEDPATSLEIARRLGLTLELVEQHLVSICSKGVPILRTFANGKVYHSIDLKFKDLQARRNVLNISPSISQQMLADKEL